MNALLRYFRALVLLRLGPRDMPDSAAPRGVLLAVNLLLAILITVAYSVMFLLSWLLLPETAGQTSFE